MSIIKKTGTIGTSSAGLPIPTEVFQLLEINPEKNRYYYRQTDEGRIFISVLPLYQKKIDEKKFVKRGTAWWIIIPVPLVALWELKPKDQIEIKLNRENLMELELIPLNSK